ncbi:MAG: VWA domain-containing protein [Pseudomonadota bacterium]
MSLPRARSMLRLLAPALLAAGLLGLANCGSSKPDFTIVSGSENESLAPLVQDFCKRQHMNCAIRYAGSLDIGLSLRPEQTTDADAVWPASSVWIDMYDSGRRVHDAKSIYQTPVVLGVRTSKARELGWVGHSVSMNDILRAVDSHRLTFLMTSATQSNSGASAYLAMLSAALGSPDTMTEAQLSNAGAQDRVKRMLRGVARSAGSSGWLGELYRDTAIEGHPYDAMWNYEAILKETNDALKQHSGTEPLYAVYPSEGSFFADAPFGYVSRGQPEKVERFFHQLQDYLLSPEAQAEIARHGRRIPLGRAPMLPPEPDWNFDPSRLVTAVPPPEPAVISHALNLYQEALRRPSLTVLCLDFSGSMEGNGESQLDEGMNFLFTPARASEALVQWSPRDKLFVIPFNDGVIDTMEGTGDPGSQAQLLQNVLSHHADGGTDMYACGARALQLMQDDLKSNTYLPAIVMMTDGRSQGDADAFINNWRNDGHNVPVFGITFGDADREQLDRLARETRARVFDGKSNLAQAFRSARGYN